MGLAIGLITSQKNEPAGGGMPGPPFAANSAFNGLSVDPGTGQIVLGNDAGGILATLATDREIPMAGNLISFTNAGDNFDINGGAGMLFSFWSGSPLVLLNDVFGNRFLQVDQNTGHFGIGDLDIQNSHLAFEMISATHLTTIKEGVLQFLLIDTQNELYGLGDLQPNGAASLQMVGSTGVDSLIGSRWFMVTPTNDVFFDLASTDAVSTIGDKGIVIKGNRIVLDSPNSTINLIGGDANGTTLSVSDSGQTLVFSSAANDYLQLDAPNQMYRMGDIDAGSPGNNTYIEIDDANNTFRLVSSLTRAFVEPQNGILAIYKSGTNTTLQVFDAAVTGGVQISAGTNSIANIGGGAITILGTGVTTNPFGAGNGVWKLGTVVAAASVLDATKYVEVEIGGVTVKLATIV